MNGSKTKTKSKKKLSNLHVRIANLRKAHSHKFTNKIVDQYQMIVIEDLNTKRMMKNSNYREQ